MLSAAGCGGRHSEFIRRSGADSLYSIEVPAFCDKSLVTDESMVWMNDDRLTFVYIFRNAPFDSVQFKKMVEKDFSKLPQSVLAGYELASSNAVTSVYKNASNKTTRYYLHAACQEYDYLTVIMAPDVYLDEKDAEHIFLSLREESSTVPAAVKQGGKTLFTWAGFSADSTLNLRYDRGYSELYAKTHKTGLTKLVGSWSCSSDTLDITNSTFVNVNVYDVREDMRRKAISMLPEDIYEGTLDRQGITSERTEFHGRPAVVSTSSSPMGSSGGKMPSKKIYIRRDSTVYTIQVSSMTGLKAKFDSTLSAIDFIGKD